MKTLFFICASFFYSALAVAQISGPLNPSSFANADLPGYNKQWVGIENVSADDGNYATFGNLTGGIGSHTDYLVATNFGFNFLPGTVFLGIMVEVECSDPNLRTSEYSVRIVKTGFIGSTEKASGRAYTAGDKYMAYGGSTDLWGESWDYKFIDDNQFGVAVSAQRGANGSTTAGRINSIRITIYYTFHTLPVQLISFTASKNNSAKCTKLQWTVASETNMDHYEVQRSADGRAFHSVSNINGRNQNNNTYSTIDNTPPLGVSYYRLKMVGNAGEEKFSKIVSVDFKSDQLILYPTVLGQGENLYITNSNNTPLQVSFFNSAGKLVATTSSSSNQLSTGQLQPLKGLFIYKVTGSGNQELGNGKIIIQ